MFNKTIIIGNLSQDINLKYIQNGSAIAKSTIASNYKYKSNNGEQKDEVCFLEFNIFGRSAEIVHQYLKKGSKVLLEGRLIYETWTGTDGKLRTKHSLRVETMKMLDNSSKENLESISKKESIKNSNFKIVNENDLTEIDEECPF